MLFNLSRTTLTRETLLQQKEGLYLLFGHYHTIGVDCGRGIMFDPVEATAMPFTAEFLDHCGMRVEWEIRKIYEC